MRRRLVILLLGVSILCLAMAPLLMPPSYSLLEHTTSESAAQGVSGAWLARTGFVFFGLGVGLLVLWNPGWTSIARGFHGLFASSMLLTAALSTRSFEPSAPFDMNQDMIHSIGATTVGFAFAFGVLAVALGRRNRSVWRLTFDLVALAASVVVPLVMAFGAEFAGVWQRVMFLVAYLWYGAEALSAGSARLRST